jgi:hypothetical protein
VSSGHVFVCRGCSASLQPQGLEGQIDVIIDDGLHRMASVKETFKNLWPLLSPTGVYLLEDIHINANLDQPGWNYPFRSMDPNNVDPSTMNFLQVLLLLRRRRRRGVFFV